MIRLSRFTRVKRFIHPRFPRRTEKFSYTGQVLLLGWKLRLHFNTQGVNVEDRARDGNRPFHARVGFFKFTRGFFSCIAPLGAKKSLSVYLLPMAAVDLIA
jgi:hypothetical protein